MEWPKQLSQSLSGWDGVFHEELERLARLARESRSQSLSGWDGVFHCIRKVGGSVTVFFVAIPFRVGWGFSLVQIRSDGIYVSDVAIPFRVGWGFSLRFPQTAWAANPRRLSANPRFARPKLPKNFEFRPGKRGENHHRKRAPPSP